MQLLLFTALRAVKVTGFANENRRWRWAKPGSPKVFRVAIAQQVRDSTVNCNVQLRFWGVVSSNKYSNETIKPEKGW